MSKKGGGSSGQTTTSTNAPPKEVLDNYNAVMARANTVASAPYQAYGGQRVADFNATQQAGLQGITNSQGMAQPYIDQASQLSNQSAQPIWQNIPQYSSENISQYMSPYTQNVVDTTMANIQRNDAVQQQGLLGHAISSGASPFGGDRAGVAAAELARNQNLASGQTIAGLENQGFQNAQQQFNQQQQLQLTGQNADAARQAQAAQLQGNLGLASQGAALQGATAQLQAGTMQQQNTQAGLDAAYQQFQEQQAFPYQQTQWLGNLALGLGSNSGGTSSTTQPTPPSMFSSWGPGLINGFRDGGRAHRAMGGGFDSFIPMDDMGVGNTMPSAPKVGEAKNPDDDMMMNMAKLAMIAAVKDGGRIHRAMGGLIPHLATGGSPYGAVSWMPQGSFSAGHSMPSAPQVQKQKSSGLDPTQMLSMGSSLFGGKTDTAKDTPVIDMSTYNNGGSYESNYGGGKNGGDWAGLLGNDGSDGWLSNAMGMAAMFRNGGRIKRDDGGFIPDDSDEVSIDTPSEGFGTMPETPAPEAGAEDITAENNPGLSIANSNPQVETKKPDLGRALIVGGLTALAGKDFDPGRNLANGALAGFSNYSGQENAIAKAQASAQKEKALEAHQSNMDSKPQMVNTGKTLQWFYPQEKDPKTGKKGLMVDTGIPTAAWATEQANAPLKAAQVDYYKSRAQNAQEPAPLPIKQDGTVDESQLPSDVTNKAQALIEGRMPYPTGLMMKQPGVKEALALAQSKDPQYDYATAPARASTYKKFTSGKSADELGGLNTSLGHYKSLMKAWQGLGNGDYPILNKVGNYTASQTGKGNISAFNQAKTLLAPELMKAYGAGHSVEETKEFAKNFDANASPEQQKAVLDMGAQLMESKIQALQDSYERGMGTVNGFDKISKIGPEGLATLQALGVDTSKYNLPSKDGKNTAPKEEIPEGGNLGANVNTPSNLPEGAKQAKDGKYYIPDPARPGKYLRVD